MNDISSFLIIALVVLLFLVVLLWKKVTRLELTVTSIQKQETEMQALLIQFTDEIKQENERFILELQRKEKKQPHMHSEDRAEVEPSAEANAELESGSEHTIYQQTNGAHASSEQPKSFTEHLKKEQKKYDSYEVPFDTARQGVIMEQSQTLQVLNLAKQGLTVEEIAQKLQIGKGEVQLILNFYR